MNGASNVISMQFVLNVNLIMNCAIILCKFRSNIEETLHDEFLSGFRKKTFISNGEEGFVDNNLLLKKFQQYSLLDLFHQNYLISSFINSQAI